MVAGVGIPWSKQYRLASLSANMDRAMRTHITYGRAGRDQGYCQKTLRCERCGDQSQARYPKNSTPDTQTNSLREKNLIVLRRQTEHHHRKYDHSAAKIQQDIIMAQVKYRTCDRANEIQAKDFSGPNPRDVRGRVVSEQIRLVKGLEDSI